MFDLYPVKFEFVCLHGNNLNHENGQPVEDYLEFQLSR